MFTSSSAIRRFLGMAAADVHEVIINVPVVNDDIPLVHANVDIHAAENNINVPHADVDDGPKELVCYAKGISA
ncbi:hypothetical protein V6N11_034354 [Hibiscus sabdariffa]|uniref:Uncharacterized protein n=1 Tax=Hibiscus sabdariffa TaxID=183260 RepID=A0ABR1ZB90_9ROSI